VIKELMNVSEIYRGSTASMALKKMILSMSLLTRPPFRVVEEKKNINREHRKTPASTISSLIDGDKTNHLKIEKLASKSMSIRN
jgi:hypothetical protein